MMTCFCVIFRMTKRFKRQMTKTTPTSGFRNTGIDAMDQRGKEAVLQTLEMARDALPERYDERIRVSQREFDQTKLMLNLHIGQLQRDLRSEVAR